MLERILVPLDGSRRAEAVLTELRVLLARHDSEVVLLRVVVPPTTMNPQEYARLLDERRTEAHAYVQRVAGELTGAGATARGVVYEGYPAEAILAGAREQAATLIALTTHGRTGLARWDLGSVTEKVLRGGECPILVTRSFETAEAGATWERRPAQAAMRRILLPIDAGDLSLVAVGPAIELASLFGAEMLLVHVLDDNLAGELPMPDIERAQEMVTTAGLHTEVVLERGDAADRILAVSAERQADLIVIATHGRSGLQRWVLGSVAERVMRAAPVPLLLVQAREAAQR
ncbi:MAG TPA: universal stress protein [Candidatus Tectomicrobia bacterium]